MGCNCKSNKLMEDKISKQFDTKFNFNDEKESLTRRIVFISLKIVATILLLPIVIILSIVFKLMKKTIKLDLNYLIKKENRIIVNE